MLFCLFFLLTLSLRRVSGQENYVEAADCKRTSLMGNRQTRHLSCPAKFLLSPNPRSFSLSPLTSHLPFLASKVGPGLRLVSLVQLVNKVTHWILFWRLAVVKPSSEAGELQAGVQPASSRREPSRRPSALGGWLLPWGPKAQELDSVLIFKYKKKLPTKISPTVAPHPISGYLPVPCQPLCWS